MIVAMNANGAHIYAKIVANKTDINIYGKLEDAVATNSFKKLEFFLNISPTT